MSAEEHELWLLTKPAGAAEPRMAGTDAFNQWKCVLRSKVLLWARAAAHIAILCCFSLNKTKKKKKERHGRETGTDGCPRPNVLQADLASLIQGWIYLSEVIVQRMRVLPIGASHGGERVQVLRQKLVIFDWLKCWKQPHGGGGNQTTKPSQKGEIYFLRYSLQSFTHCNLVFFISHLGYRNFPQQAPLSSQLQSTLKYDKRVRALIGSILHHPQPLLVVLPGQMKLECTYSCSEL